MATGGILNKIKGVQVVKPSDHVIQQLRNLIVNNEIRPGDVLPSERDLANSFGIGRGYVREAIKTLELYGVFKSVPGVGTIVSDLGTQCVTDFINNLVQFSVHEYEELIEVRALIEPFTAYRAATNATDEELRTIGRVFEDLSKVIAKNEVNLQLECDFHMEIAKASHNSILANTINAILPGLIKLIDDLDMAKDGRHVKSHDEHVRLYEALRNRNPQEAERAMHHHMAQTGAHFSVRVSDIEEKQNSRRIIRKKGAEKGEEGQ